MTGYETLVMQAQSNYSRFYNVYRAGGSPYRMSEKPRLPYGEQVREFARQVREAEVVIVGGASGLSAAGGGDFYYEDNESYRRYFGPFAEKYHFKGAFDGMMHRWGTREEYWGYLATFLSTTLNAPVREPYLDLDSILKGKEFHVITTNQDTQFVKMYDESNVAELQGDHRLLQCSVPCHDGTWDAVGPVGEMVGAMGGGTSVPTELIPRCPRCGREAFPWVRGYGNFLEGRKYMEEYDKATRFVEGTEGRRTLYIELGVGRLTPMFIQEPFWSLTLSNPDARYIAVNDRYAFLPEQIEDRGMVVLGDIAGVLADVRKEMEASERGSGLYPGRVRPPAPHVDRHQATAGLRGHPG